MKAKFRKAAAAGIGLALAASLGAVPAWAYFTDVTTANGSISISVRPDTSITEEYGDGVKHLVIHNEESSTVPVFARVGVFASGDFADMSIAGDGWSAADGSGWDGPDGMGWFYYGASADEPTAIDPASDSSEIAVSFSFPEKQTGEYAEGAVEGDQYNVVVVYETVPATYADDGSASPQWDARYSSTEGGN